MSANTTTTLTVTTSVSMQHSLAQTRIVTEYLLIFGFCLSIIGMALNYLCYITAEELPSSSSAFLMKHLAVWDSVTASVNGVVRLGLPYLGLFLLDMNVSSLL